MRISENMIFMSAWDNFHFHARQGEVRMEVVRHLVSYCDRATIMPNEAPPLLTGSQVAQSKMHLMNVAHHWGHPNFTPLMTLYVTEKTTVDMIDEAHACGVRYVKVYPKDVTTGSEYGVSDYGKIVPVLRRCGELGMIVLLHGEHPSLEVEGVHKEAVFLDDILPMLLYECKGKFVLEHVSTQRAVGFILNRWNGKDNRLAGTITPHHLIHINDDVAGYGPASGYQAQPILHCKPCIKLRRDREALLGAVMNGAPCFFYGGDDAPHPDSKRSLNGYACGVWVTIAAPSMLIELFRERDKLTLLENFTSGFGADFYGLTRNSREICFVREDWEVPKKVLVPGTPEVLTPWMAGKSAKWKLAA